MMLIIFHSFTRKRADSVDLIGILIPKLRYSYSASWQTLNFVYVFFTVLRMTTFFLFRTSPCSYNFPNSFWELFTSPKGLHICQQEYCFFCVVSITGRDVDSQASLKMSEVGQGLWFWSESLVEKGKGQPPGQTYRPKCCVWKNAPFFLSLFHTFWYMWNTPVPPSLRQNDPWGGTCMSHSNSEDNLIWFFFSPFDFQKPLALFKTTLTLLKV